MDFPLMVEATNLILKILKQYGIKASGNSPQDVLRSYFNLKHKSIRAQPRAVLASHGLLAKADSLKVKGVLDIIETRFIKGDDVNPFLSKGAFRSDSHDYLLNDWKIHHLHLNAAKNKRTDYFNARSQWLLFIHVTEDRAYFIDIRHHNENYVFAQRDLLRIIRDNWPDLNKEFLLSSQEMKISPDLDEMGIATLRRKGYMFFTQVDNHAYAPGLGSAVNGFSTQAGMEMNEFHRELFKIQTYADRHEKEIIALIEKNSGAKLPSIHLTLAYKDWMFYVYEANSRQFVNFDLAGYNPHEKDEDGPNV